MYDWRIFITDIKNLIIDLKNLSIKIYLHILSVNATYTKLHRWFTFLVPLYLNKTWIQPLKESKLVYYFGVFLENLIAVLIFFLLSLWFWIDFANRVITQMCADIRSFTCLSVFDYILFTYQESRSVSIKTNTLLFFYIFMYSFVCLFNFYVLWSLWDLWLYVNRDPCNWIEYTSTDIPNSSIQALWQILYSDMTPYSVFEDANRYRLGQLFNLIKYNGPLPLHNEVPWQQYKSAVTLNYCVNYMLLLIFLTLIHVLKRIKHLFDDYLRDIDSQLATCFYRILCFISLFFFFANKLQLTEYLINLFSATNLIVFFSIYSFFFCVYAILYFYTIFSTNIHKQLLLLYFMYYFFSLIIVFFCYVSCAAFISDKLLCLYLDFKAICQGRSGTTFSHLIFSDNTPRISNKYLTYQGVQERALRAQRFHEATLHIKLKCKGPYWIVDDDPSDPCMVLPPPGVTADVMKPWYSSPGWIISPRSISRHDISPKEQMLYDAEANVVLARGKIVISGNEAFFQISKKYVDYEILDYPVK